MSYRVLYRRFRPKSFSEIVGQEHIIPILRNQIKTGKISHAYLFSGPKGTGKTSAAKVFAKAANCLSPEDGEACGKCDYCLSFDSGGFTDIVEIDAASNRGIDEIRRLKDNVGFLPAKGRFRVYIIDEVHMLTQEAFNALLKTLEEPPAHVIFIFATTEQYKVLPTILSRCQRFDFKRIPEDIIVSRLSYALDTIGAKYDEKALKLIAANSDGALRDAFTLTDKALTLAQGGVLNAADASGALGQTQTNAVFAIAEAVTDENASQAVLALDNAIKEGGDIGYIMNQLIEYFRCLMIYSLSPETETIISKGENYIKSLKKSGVNADTETLTAYVIILSKAKADARYMTNSRFALESALVYLSDKARITEAISLKARVEKLEKRIAGLEKRMAEKNFASKPDTLEQSFIAADKIEEPKIQKADETKTEQTKQQARPVRRADKETLAKLKKEIEFAAGYILNRDRDIMLSDIFSNMHVDDYDGESLYIYPTSTAVHMMDVFEAKEGAEKLANILSSRLKKQISVKITDKKSKSVPKNVVSLVKEVFGSDVSEIE